MNATFIAELIKRLQSESPDFFKKLMKYVIVLMVLLFVFLQLVNYKLVDLGEKTDVFTTAIKGLLLFLSGVTGTSFLPQSDSTTKDNSSTADTTADGTK